MWRHIAHSLEGPSHAADGAVCQDSHLVRVLGDSANAALAACIADGAGSAAHAEAGSAIACATIMERAAAHYETAGGFDGLVREDVLDWCEAARERIAAEAQERGCDCRDLATTLCAALIDANCSVFFQIGDGAIIRASRGMYGVVFWPQSGEYANSTNFLTSEEYRDRLDFLTTTSHCSGVALFTDGLERLALRFDSRTPYAPFFDPLFRALRTTEDVAGLNEDLRHFLASDSVQARSDDDKTLILATRRDADDAA